MILWTWHNKRGFSLIETLFAFGIVFIASICTIAAIIYTRQSMELDKQRLAALNYCRQAMESCQSNNPVQSHSEVLVPFNAPGAENLNCQISVKYYSILNNGVPDIANPLATPVGGGPVYCVVEVKWDPVGPGSIRHQTISMTSVVRAGTL